MINFPDSPTLSQSFSVGQTIWQWDSVKWVSSGSGVNMLVDATNATLPVARANLVATPHLATNAVLGSARTTDYPTGVWRDDFSAGFGAPPLWYVPSNSASSLNAGNGDNGSQVKSADGKCWIAVFPGVGADLRQWGADPMGVVSCTTQMNAALAWAARTKGKIIVPAGIFFLATPASVTIPANVSLSIMGVGADQSCIAASTGDAVVLTYVDATSSCHVRDLSFLARSAPSGSALKLLQTNSPSSIQTAFSDVSDVTFRGSDGYGKTNYWANGVYLDYVSNVNFTNDFFIGPQTPTFAGNGLNLAGGGDSTHIGVVYNISGTTFDYLANGVLYGGSIQGVAINQTNFVANINAIHVPATSNDNVAQLTIVNSQFGFNNYCLLDELGMPALIVTGNLFFLEGNVPLIGIQTLAVGGILTNNFFQGDDNTRGLAIHITSDNDGATISGNFFFQIQTAIQLDSGVWHVQVLQNMYESNQNNIVNLNTNNTNFNFQNAIHAAHPGSTIVFGAADNGSGNMARLTVGSTAGMVNGQFVSITGIGGTGNISWLNCITPVTVIDSTHIDLLVTGFPPSSTYTSGGTVSNVP